MVYIQGMKLYRHYKNKYYKHVGEAKHSEQLEDVVIYQPLYSNPDQKLWVRPKQMFHEEIEWGGEKIARFAEVRLDIQTSAIVGIEQGHSIAVVMEKVFGTWDAKWFQSKLENHTSFFVVTALIDQEPVGFKLGYERDGKEFYSWLGGVIPEYRGLGIASELMQTQHTWCREQGYQSIQTNTQNRFREMLFLNLKFGFNIIGTVLADKDELKIQMEKKLE